MKTVKILNEEIDQLRFEAKGIFEAAKRGNEGAGREMTEDESARFDLITDKKDGLIAKLKTQLSQAEDREKAILEMSVRESREKSLAELEGELETVRPARVLDRTEAKADDQPTRIYQRQAKLKAFKNERDAFNCGMWLRAMIAKAWNRDDQVAAAHVHRLGWKVTNVGIEGTGTLGGYTVPSPMSQTIIDVREMVGVARKILKIMPMTSDTLSIPRRDGGLTVYYVGEASSITLSDKLWGQVELIAKKRAVAHQISQELQDDSIISIVDDAMSEMAYALAAKEDAETINGDGTSTYGGVTGLLSSIGSAGVSTAATGHDTWGELDMADVTAAMGLLPDKYSRNPVWVSSANFYWSVLARLGATAGGNNINSLMVGPEGEPRFLGRPVYFTDQMPKTTGVSQVSALFGTFDMGAILGERTGIQMARSDDYAFLNDVTTLKATTRYDIQVHAPGDASNAGAYIALKTAA